jgi:hypothetical protein
MKQLSRLARVLLPLVGLAAVAACAAQRTTSPDAAGQAGAPLVSSLQVEQYDDSVALTLQVTNASAAPVALTFPTGQSYDFLVEHAGREVWRWSGDQIFTQAIRIETLAPGQTERFQATWHPAPGESTKDFTAVGFLTAQEYRGEQRARFRLP